MSMLNGEKVRSVFMDCLFQEGEDSSKHIRADGVVTNVGFHPGRLEQHRAEIVEMLDELPDQFKESSGGGWSFLQACDDKHGNQWTDFHQRMEQLFQLGIGISRVKCLVPRELWKALPGGMPYYVILDKDKATEAEAS
jgi:hypothetical protein